MRPAPAPRPTTGHLVAASSRSAARARSKTIARTLSYEPWGDTNISTGTPYTGPRFTGVYQDDTTGLYRMDAHFYQPGRGRFTQLDPLPSSVLSANRYAYTGCNPVTNSDPTGLSHRSAETTDGYWWNLVGWVVLAGVASVLTGGNPLAAILVILVLSPSIAAAFAPWASCALHW